MESMTTYSVWLICPVDGERCISTGLTLTDARLRARLFGSLRRLPWENRDQRTGDVVETNR